MESPSRGNGVGTADHSIQPERYWTKPTAYCPNSPLPVLVYRGVFDPNVTVEEASKILQANHWIKGGVFKHYPAHHYHSNTHECYAAIRGNTKCVYGVGPLDDESDGVTFEMSAGDIAVHAAGVAHRNSESSLDYEYIGAYPEGSPHWDNNFCIAEPHDTHERALSARGVQIPDFDPVSGLGGPLVSIWRAAAKR